jgi:hypothetical protein
VARAHQDIQLGTWSLAAIPTCAGFVCAAAPAEPKRGRCRTSRPLTPSEPERRSALASTMDALLELFKVSIYWVLLKSGNSAGCY